MIGIVKRRTHQVVHGSIDNGKVLLLAVLEIFHSREQHTGVADQRTTRFDDKFLTATLQHLQQRTRIIGNRRRCFVVVTNAKAAAKVEMLKPDSLRRQSVHQRQHFFCRCNERTDLGQLRTDMAIHAGDKQVRHGRCFTVQVKSLGVGHAELVLLQPGGDIWMGLRIDIRVHTQAYRSRGPHLSGHFIEPFQFRCRFHVETQDAALNGLSHFGCRFADP